MKQTGMVKKHKASSLDTPACHLVTTLLLTLTAPQRSQREITTLGSYQLPSYQLELPTILM
jgi:hypothetical protein